MNIQPISTFSPTSAIYKKQEKPQVSRPETTGIPAMYAYKDFNITFGARLFRSPQNFYEQDFNEQNMPLSLHKYIYEEGDAAFKRSIPPSQAMREVFGKIEQANNLDEVRQMYPDEPLFANLTSKPNKNAREGLLGMINLLKQDSDFEDKTLFKNGDDDLGLYILKKIYIEGKSLKEINKDFNNDVNPEFRSYDITSSDYSAYGIRFPEQSFWRSFVPTRENFPYVFIPRKNSGSNQEIKTHNSKNSETQRTEEKDSTPKPRKYRLKNYQVNQIKKDVVDSNGDIKSIERKVVKRFRKDDPEASFIVKYLSPIMTLAADRIHLSEEMKNFSEYENSLEKKQNNTTFFERFWKANPQMLQDYSQAITDTIEMFQDVYGAGGMLPLNKEFEEITKNSENQKAIDYVTPEFLELLDYTKTIEPRRNERYLEHDKQQALWEAHFKERYGEVNSVEMTEEPLPANTETTEIEEINMDILRKTANQYGAEVIELKGKTGEQICITGNINEAFEEVIKENAKYYPSAYRNAFIRFMKTNPEISDRYKLSVATRQVKDLIDDDRIMSDEEFEDETSTIYSLFRYINSKKTIAASIAMFEILRKYSTLDEPIPAKMLELYPEEYTSFNNDEKVSAEFSNVFSRHAKELNEAYENYSKKITTGEQIKIQRTMMELLSNYTPCEDLEPKEIQEILLIWKEMINSLKFRKTMTSEMIKTMFSSESFTRVFLDKTKSREEKMEYLEFCMGLLIRNVLKEEPSILIKILNRETLEAHRHNLTPSTYNTLIENSKYLDEFDRHLFNLPISELKKLDVKYKKN